MDSDARVDRRIAVVTGGGRGIGRACAMALAREGYDVALCARSTGEASRVVTEISATTGRRALWERVNVSDPGQVDAFAARVRAELGPTELLLNNAGIAWFAPFLELSRQTWRETLEVNLLGAVYCCQAFVPHMLERGRGRIINMASVTGLKAIARQSAYTASKHGLIGLTRALALELREYGIAAHALCPGGVVTRMSEEAMPERDKSDWPTPEDIADAVVYLSRLSPRVALDVMVLRRFGSEPLG
ncbi:MAG TPA: SDR family oxidoreductase [Candidatus Hydrogenedentes bacterium]|nr:SDR family oxidoreductase [Candidatus Hydrogenedentota bacterium]